MKILFFGTDDFAARHCEALIGSGHEIVACVTSPDRPKGRGMHIQQSVVKELSIKNKIDVLQPDDLTAESFIQELKQLAADIVVVIAYGRLLPEALLSVAPKGAVNVHASLLPKYRGAAPINWAIIKGERETGITIFKLNARFDAGDVLSQVKVPIEEHDTSVSVRQKLLEKGPALLLATLKDIEQDSCSLFPQDPSLVCLAPKLTKQLGCIQWDAPARDIHNLVRGLLPWPGAYTRFEGKTLKIRATEISDVDTSSLPAGEIVGITKQGLCVAAKDKGIFITQVHLESANPMDAQSFIAGHKVAVGYRLK